MALCTAGSVQWHQSPVETQHTKRTERRAKGRFCTLVNKNPSCFAEGARGERTSAGFHEMCAFVCYQAEPWSKVKTDTESDN